MVFDSNVLCKTVANRSLININHLLTWLGLFQNKYDVYIYTYKY